MPSTWPIFGSPPGFTPPFEGASVVMYSTQQVMPLPFSIEANLVVHIAAPPIVHTRVQPQFKDYQQIYHAHESSNEENKMHDDIKGIKENY